MKQICCYFLLFTSLVTYSQSNQSPSDIVSTLLESMSDEESDQDKYNQLYEDLVDLYQHPININVISREDLEKLVFLSDFQIRNILEFVFVHKPILSKYQLQGIKGMHMADIQSLLMFVIVGVEDEYKDKRQFFNGQVLARDLFLVESAKGYIRSDTTPAPYMGNKHHIYSRIQADYGKRFYAGMVLDKDPGERMYNNDMMPADFTSGYFMYKGTKWLKQVIVGDYHVNFGQGLAMWSGTSMGKTTEPTNVRKRNSGLKKYSSANEERFFRGVGISIDVNNWELDTFVSSRYKDGRPEFDSIHQKLVITSLPESGLHRTLSEIETKDRVKQKVVGANVNYRWKNWTLSGGGYSESLNADSLENNQMYEALNNHGIFNNYYWFGYNYGSKRIYCFGETAMSDYSGVSFVNGFLFKPVGNVSLSMLYRNYSRYFHSEWSGAFAESNNSSGESGLYMGANIFPFRNFEINAYADVFKYKWLKYNIDKPSSGFDFSVDCKYKFSSDIELNLRYREKEKMKNRQTTGEACYPVDSYNVKKIRMNTKVSLDNHWAFQFRIEQSYYNETNESLSKGVLGFADINYKSAHNRFAFWLRYLVFNTDDYNSRIYAYENDLLYNFSVPAFQDEGSRTYLLGRWHITGNVKFWIKVSQTWYADKTELGSGFQALDGNTKTRISSQVQIKF